MKTIEAGVFLPVGNHGWIHSTNSPAAEDGSYPRVLEITRLAERLGFDFVLSPAIWRGRKGPSEHWMRSLESMTTSAALLQATSRITVFGTIHMTVYPPAVIAKMMTTLDQIGPGRVGLNLVTGSSYLDLHHIGLWLDGPSHDERYDIADEWTKVVRRLWTEPVVSHKGRYFELSEATMGPKPSRLPRLANAGASGRGVAYAVENCDIAFISCGEDAKQVEAGRQVRVLANARNKPDLKVFGLLTVIPAATDAEARARLDHFNAGVDEICLADIALGYTLNPNIKDVSPNSLKLAGGGRNAVTAGALVGGHESLSRRIADIVKACDLDGVVLILPDYVADMPAFAAKVLGGMAAYGIGCRTTAA